MWSNFFPPISIISKPYTDKYQILYNSSSTTWLPVALMYKRMSVGLFTPKLYLVSVYTHTYIYTPALLMSGYDAFVGLEGNIMAVYTLTDPSLGSAAGPFRGPRFRSRALVC